MGWAVLVIVVGLLFYALVDASADARRRGPLVGDGSKEWGEDE